MKKIGFIFAFALVFHLNAQDPIKATVSPYKEISEIHPYVYGMFTELLGNIFDHVYGPSC